MQFPEQRLVTKEPIGLIHNSLGHRPKKIKYGEKLLRDKTKQFGRQ